MKGERDTHFAGFASLLLNQLKPDLALLFHSLGTNKGVESAEAIIKQVIAQRAYDLVAHALESIAPYQLDIRTMDECIEAIPDMTEWPKE